MVFSAHPCSFALPRAGLCTRVVLSCANTIGLPFEGCLFSAQTTGTTVPSVKVSDVAMLGCGFAARRHRSHHYHWPPLTHTAHTHHTHTTSHPPYIPHVSFPRPRPYHTHPTPLPPKGVYYPGGVYYSVQGHQRGYPHEASQNLLKWQICERSFKRNDIPLVSEICVHYSTMYCNVQYCLIFKEAGLKEACLRGSLASRRLIFKEAGLKEACLRGGLALRKLILLIFKEAGLKEACLQGGLAPPKTHQNKNSP